MQSAVISRIVTNASTNYIAQSKDSTKVIVGSQTREETEELRSAYEKIIVMDNWDQQFADAAKLIIENLRKNKELIPVKNTTFSIAQSNQYFTFDKNYILIGRKPGCHVAFPEDSYNGTSRMHAMIFPLPELNMLIVVDMGSLSGILTQKRSSDKQLVHSFAKSRNVLIFDWNEVVILKMGSIEVGINTKECVVCMTNPRSVTFGCGHNSTCDSCSQKLETCPICRAQINNKKAGFALRTNVK